MRRMKRRYIEILRIELEDLKEDLELLIDESKRDRKSGRLTDHVFFANLALFKNELLGVDTFFKIVNEIDPEKFEDVNGLVDHLRTVFREKVKFYDLAEAINVCVERKLMKVARYVTQSSGNTV